MKLPARSNGDLAQAATEPTRRLNVPSSTRGGDTLTAQPRRIRREDIEGEGGPSGSSGGLSPTMGSGGSVGLGGKF